MVAIIQISIDRTSVKSTVISYMHVIGRSSCFNSVFNLTFNLTKVMICFKNIPLL